MCVCSSIICQMNVRQLTVFIVECKMDNIHYVHGSRWVVFVFATAAAAPVAAGHIKVLENFMSQKIVSWINFKRIEPSKQLTSQPRGAKQWLVSEKKIKQNSTI